MDNKKALITLGTFLSIAVSSVGIYGLNSINSGQNKYLDFSNNIYSKNFINWRKSLSNENALQKVGQENSFELNDGYQNLYYNDEKLLYKKISSICNNITDNKKQKTNLYWLPVIIIPNSQLEVGQIRKVYQAFTNDHPEVFWLNKTFGYSHTEDNSTIVLLYSTLSKAEKDEAQLKLERKIYQILNSMPYTNSEYEMELFFHDYIANNCKYQIRQNDPNIYNSYGCLINNVAVCEGYARAFQLLLSKCGIQAFIVRGTSHNERHAWNIVKINGRFYHVDVTWDNDKDYWKYNYFNVDDNTIRLDHNITPYLEKSVVWPEDKDYNFMLPVCNMKVDNFYERNAIKTEDIRTSEDLTNHLIKLAKNKKEYMYIKANSREEIENFELFGVFKCINNANRVLSNDKKLVVPKSISYGISNTQNVLSLKLEYEQGRNNDK